jgi:uncharacterized repeat protein (TIGR04076 family)
MPVARITVLKRTFQHDLVDAYVQDKEFRQQFGKCSVFEEGQTFVSEDWPSKPEGFCERAWPNIHHEVAMVMYGSSIPWIEEPGYTITCCNDGLRPVIFLIERVEDDEIDAIDRIDGQPDISQSTGRGSNSVPPSADEIGETHSAVG